MPTSQDQPTPPATLPAHLNAADTIEEGDTNPLAYLDRRRHHRFETTREGKVFRRATQRFEPARTRDLSAGGAMLEVECERPFAVGEIIDLGIAPPQRTIMREDSLLHGIVMRTRTLGPSRQSVAVRYLGAAVLSRAA